tara:strand:+ start:102 stop:341 length:240 start_codon:yes stop_codon:yes gene_type:complete
MKPLKNSKGARKGGRPKKTESGLINVAPYMRFMKRVCAYKLVYDQLDNLEYDIFNNTKCDQQEVQKRIAQIKQDIKNLK